MDGVGRNGADVRFNCSSICINDEHIRVQFGGHSLVETSCKPEPHVFHLGCITRHLDEQSETSLDQRRCSECEQTALPLIRKDGESDDDDESPYCESRMLNVCRSGNLRMLNRHLEKDKTLVNQPYRSALTGHPEYLLAVALKHQHTGLARTLIDHGADVNAADHQGETPLHTAARQRCTEVFNILIEAGANINNVLRTAVREGNDSLLEYLISTELSQSKLNIALREAAGQGRSQYLIPLMNKGANDLNGALREAAGQGQKQCLETLISPRVSQRTPDLNGALCAAAEGGQTECLRFLIEKGANELDLDHALNRAILARNNPSRTVLVEEGANITTVVHTAARKGDWEFFNYLNDPTEINATDGEGQTPLHITAANGDKTCLKKLIEKGANVNASNNNGETALHIATKISITKGRQQCAAMGIDITGNFINGKTFEHYTIEKENDIGCLCELADNRGVDFNARDNHGITPLMIATLWSKLDHLTYLLERADINIADNSGNTALHLAACWGQTDCLRKLLDKKVDVNVKTHTDGATPLHMAAQNGHIESVKELLKNYQSPVNEQMNDGCTPLHLAARNGHTEIVRAFKEIAPMRIRVDVKNNNGDMALHEAARQGHTETVNALLEIDRSPLLAKAKNNDDETALHTAAAKGHKKAIQTLLDFDPSLAKEKTNDAQTALHAAALKGQTEAIQTLLDFDRSLAKEKDKNGQTALHYAIYNGQTVAIQALLNFDRSLAKEKDENGQTALHSAALQGHTEAIQSLLDFDRSLAKEKDRNSLTALHYAAEKGQTEAIQTLLDFDPSLAKEKSNHGWTALHKAAEKGHTEAIQTLLDFDRSLAKEKDRNGLTALHSAAYQGHTEAIQALLSFAPSLAKEKSSHGQTALHSAAYQGHTEAIQSLLDFDGSMAKEKNNGFTALHHAAEKGRTEAIQALLDFDPSLSKEKNNDDFTALHLAANKGHTEAIQALLDFAPSLAKEKHRRNGYTALHLAADKGHTEAIQALLDFDPSLSKEKNNDGFTAFHLAANKGHTEAIQALLDFAPSLAKEKANNGQTAIHLAAHQGHTEAIQTLLDFAPSLAKEKHRRTGFTALHLAANKGHTEAIQALLDFAPFLAKKKDRNGLTALHVVAEKGHTEAIQILLDFDPSLTKEKASNDQTALHSAAYGGQTEAIQALLDFDPSLAKEKDSNGLTALHYATEYAAEKGHTEAIQTLLDFDPSLAKEKNKFGETALHAASFFKGHTEAIQVLLTIAPSLAKAKDKYGHTALNIAAEKGHTEAVQILQAFDRSQAKVKDKNFETALNLAKGLKKTVKVLKNFAVFRADHEKDNSKLTTKVKIDDTKKADKTAQAGSVATNDPAPTDSKTAVDSRKKSFNEGPDNDPEPRELSTIESPAISENRTAMADSAAEVDSIVYPQEYPHPGEVKTKDVDELGKSVLHKLAEQGKEMSLFTELYGISEEDRNQTDNSGKTPLHYVAEKGFKSCLEQLFSKANINKTDNSGKTPLHYAILNKDKDKGEKFLEVFCKKVQHFSPTNISHALRLAIDENYDSESTEKLVNRIRLEEEDKDETDGKTLLHYAAEKGHKNYLEKFLEKAKREGKLAESINLQDHKKRTPLHYAAEKKHSNCLQLLLKKDKELTCINAKDENGDTPLLLADTDACVRELIRAKADVHEKNNKGITLMHRIAMSENRINWLNENYKSLKEDIIKPDKDDNTPLHYAAYNGNKRFLHVIHTNEKGKIFKKDTIDNNFHINNKQGVSPLLLTIHNDNKNECLKKLIKMITLDSDQLSRLFLYAAAYGKEDCLQKIFDEKLNEKIDINHTVQNNGMAALHYVVIDKCWNHNSSQEVQGYKECLEHILSFDEKVDVNLKDNEGKTPLHLAAEADNIYCLKRLLDHAKCLPDRTKLSKLIKAADKQGKTPLHLAAEADNIQCLKRLLDETKDTVMINAEDKQGKTPLHLAAEADNIQCLIGLLDQTKHPVNINAEDKQKNKPRDLAKEHSLCQEALQEDWSNLNGCERKDKGKYYLNKYKKCFEGQVYQTNYQNENAHSQSNPVGLSDGSIHYQEKVFIDKELVERLDEIEKKYPELNFIPCPEVSSFVVLAKDFFDKIIEGSHEDAIFGYSGIRGNRNTKNPKDLKQIYVPVQFIPGSGLYDLSLEGYPFHIEGTKGKIIEFLGKHDEYHFTVKSIEKKEQSKARVSVNIKLCLDDCDLPKMVRNFFVAPIKDTFGQIPLEFIGGIFEHADLQGLLKKISDAVNTSKEKLQEKLQEEVVKNAGKMQENLGSEAAKQPEEIKSRKFDSTINKIRNELKRLNENETDIGTALSENNFEVCSGPIHLLYNIKNDQKIQIEFDRFESSNSPARLQINSTGSQVKFKDLSEALKVLFK